MLFPWFPKEHPLSHRRSQIPPYPTDSPSSPRRASRGAARLGRARPSARCAHAPRHPAAVRGAAARGARRAVPRAQAARFSSASSSCAHSPIAIHTDAANAQHYELPPAFFESASGGA